MPAITFKARSTTELLHLRAAEQPNDPAIYTGISEPAPMIKLRYLTYKDLLRAVDRLAWYYSSLDLMPKTAPGQVPPVRSIAVLVTSAIDETLLELALAKLGLTALLLSVNNSVAAVAHLVKLVNATHLIYSPKFFEEAKEAQSLLASQGVDIMTIEDKRFSLWGLEGIENADTKPFPAVLTPEQESPRPAIYLHSSGSTGFPKPVAVTHYGLIANIAINQDKTGFSTLPVFHGYGHFALFRCMYPGKPFVLFPPHLPLTSANICAVHAIAPDCRQCFAVPYVIKLLGETEEGVKMMASFDVVSYAGAPLPDDLGTRLVTAGVNILSIYGTTETGTLMNSSRNFVTDKEWNWVRPTSLSKHYLAFEPQGNNTFEIIVKDGYPPKIETNRPDGSYATKDLFLRHPEHDDRYRYIGRLDDTLVHILGEKTNPVPIELGIRGNSPYVAEAIVFGAGKPQTGCLILPSELAKDMSQEEMMEKVWPVVEEVNEQAPSHSRLLPEMIEVLPYGTTIPVATKMSILRPACYAKFKDLIESIYTRFEQGSSEIVRKRLNKDELENYLLEVITKTIGPAKAAKLDKQADLFALGVDSLQATRVRNICQKELDLDGHTLGQNVVYEQPSVEKLTDYILGLRSGNTKTGDAQSKMIQMVDKWAAKLETRKLSTDSKPKPINARVIVLTGATGSLGAHILHQLLSSLVVRKVICLSRASSHEESRTRVKESLKLRKLPLPVEGKFDSYAANPNSPLLGLKEEEYRTIQNEVTDVIHNAWPVNFNISIDSFDEYVGGSLNLMNLCLRSSFSEAASFYFSSSISCRQGSPDETCSENYPDSPATAAGTGYAQSKWVVEKLCQKANEIAGLPVGVLRIGQMVGDTVNGVWNETEAWPLMFKSTNTVGALPDIDENPSWLPVDYAGSAIAEIVTRREPLSTSEVYHIVNPNVSVGWNEILDGLESAGLHFDRVDIRTWLERLANSDQDGERNPSIKLLPFWRQRWSKPRKPMIFLTEKTSSVAPSIGKSPPVTEDLVQKWVRHWQEVGFLN
ncbi:L-aminoadipate-semialdehyde dehydrogenase [Dendrothele bispora CBS 962.96]|uniref:L-aminoadipate-semialdehyde dehydrogenase n=1 Tax=Dendrothele bispora (strain CBS 962.96) TaxID=1314807 RepID=A0A4S8ML22_DENBC|nr:L-aminoadipate-semialdehyde dehydrogenase [Dendrothele bispora CBS 962.96]